MIQFLNPIWLWALAGLLFPLGIHLLSRKEGKVFLIGSTRFIEETRTSRFSSIRLNEILLLLLRCIMITLLVFYISGLSFSSDEPEKWLLLERGVEEYGLSNVIRDSLTKSGYQVRFFSHGFPFHADSPGRSNYWALIQALNKKPLQNIVILSRQHIVNFSGERVHLPSNVRWIGLPSMPERDFVAAHGLNGSTNEFSTSFENEIPISFNGLATKTVNISYDSSLSYDKKVLVAALGSIQEAFGVHFEIRINPAELNPEADLHFKLDPSKSEEEDTMIAHGDITPGEQDFLTPDNAQHKSYVITRRLTPDEVVDEKLMLQLARVLLAEDDSLDESYPDARVMPDEMLWKSGTPPSTNAIPPARTETPWLLLVFVTVLIIERYISKIRHQ